MSVFIYKPELKEDVFSGSRVLQKAFQCIEISDAVFVNKKADNLINSAEKYFSRDLCGKN